MTTTIVKSLSVCAITTWPPYRDGIALYSAKLYERMADFAHIEIIANKVGARTPNDYGQNNIAIHRRWSRGNVFSLLQVFHQVVKSRAHILHVHYGWLLYGFSSTLLIPFLLLAIRFTGKPVVLTMHTVIQRNAKLYNNGFLNKVADSVIFALTVLLTRFPQEVIVHNHLVKKGLEESYGCKSEKIVIIPHGVVRADSTNHSGKNACREQMILSLGFLREDKKLESLLQAFSRFSLENPIARLFLAGGRHPHDNDKYVKKIRNLISSLGLGDKVQWMNFVPDEELDEYLGESEFIVLLSTKDYFLETSGALARVADFGKPVICSRVPKFQAELKDTYNCLMVTPGNVDELTMAMRVLAKSDKLKEQLGSNLKRHSMAKYWPEVVKMHLNLYSSLLRFK
jgi:glycosyltransferase involved in cell wall biosynthesis